MKDAILPEDRLLNLIKSAPAEKIKFSSPRISSTVEKFPRALMKIAFFTGIGFAIFSFIVPFYSIKNLDLTLKKETRAKKGIGEMIENNQRSVDPYIALVNSKKLFKNSTLQNQNNTQKKVDTELFSEISLVGIITGNNPQAIIQDKKTEKSYYLSIGQSMGEAKLKDIQEGKIVLDYNNQNYELFL